MSAFRLKHDPYNLIITGVGGQGNVLASRIVGDILSMQGFDVIGHIILSAAKNLTGSEG